MYSVWTRINGTIHSHSAQYYKNGDGVCIIAGVDNNAAKRLKVRLKEIYGDKIVWIEED